VQRAALDHETAPAAVRARAEKQYVVPGAPLNVALVAAVALCQSEAVPNAPFNPAVCKDTSNVATDEALLDAHAAVKDTAVWKAAVGSVIAGGSGATTAVGPPRATASPPLVFA
jgi:hypothetical protein